MRQKGTKQIFSHENPYERRNIEQVKFTGQGANEIFSKSVKRLHTYYENLLRCVSVRTISIREVFTPPCYSL